MGDENKKKGFFRRAADSFSSKDVKAERDEAKKAALQSQTKEGLASSQANVTAQKELQAADKLAKEAEAGKKHLEQEDNIKKMQNMIRTRATEEANRETARDALANAGAHVPTPQALVKHTIAEGETLSDIAMKLYGHSTRDYWMLIYEANKTAIGDNPGLVKPGMELTIPILPDSLKDK